MKILICISFFLMCIYSDCHCQTLVITDSTTTPSICFNDGTITVGASGGSGTYTYTIISGPSYPNIVYPIALTSGSTFLTMPKGEYTIKVTDGAGNTAFATATVGGTYTFPVFDPPLADTIYSTCITVYEQGGRPPFTYSRSSVSTNAGFGPYQSSNSFCNLCNGVYWIRIKDSCQNIYTSNKIVVEVPVPNYSVTYKTVGNIDSVYVTVTSAGAPPYSYNLSSGSISITNGTGVFGIPVACPPDNITVTDSCGRVFHTTIDIHSLSATVTSICGSGSADIRIDSGAIGPFTITGSNGTLVTNQNIISFNSLPLDSQYHFTIKDSCGNIVNASSVCLDTTFFYNVCPFDSSIHMLANTIPFCFPLVVTCLTCSPNQIDTVYSLPAKVFTGIQEGVPYSVRIQDQCGFNYVAIDTPGFAPLQIADSIITCQDFRVFSVPPFFSPPITYLLYHQLSLLDSVNTLDPVFYHLPAGTYQVKATQPLCAATTITVILPDIGGACIVPMMDSTCRRSYAIYQTLPDYSEVWSLINTATSAAYVQKKPNPYPGAIVFDAVPVGSYNLVSDSGCSVPIVLPAFNHTVSATTTHQCTGSSTIKVVCTPPINSCNTSQKAYYTLMKDNQYIANSSTGLFTVLDTGYYVVKLFLSNTTIFGFDVKHDTICPLDTVKILVLSDSLPNIISSQVEVCGNTKDNIPYTIFGGTPPYTVQILGYPTQIDSVSTDTFPNVNPGVYTMIVSDNCGISRSFSVSVVDTCSTNCVTKSAFSLNDSIACANAVVTMNNQSLAATHYKWNINGSVYAYAADTSFKTTTPGTYHITLYAYIGNCVDSSKRTIVIQDTLHDLAKSDTTLCSPFSLKLNTHQSNTLWSTGVKDSVITVNAEGTYTAVLSDACSTAYDTAVVKTYPGITGFDLTDSKDFLCEDILDSAVLIASIDSNGQAPVLFRWNSGVVDSPAYSSEIIVYQAGVYQIKVNNGFCPLVKSITIDTMSCDSECIAGIAIPDIFSPNGDGRNDTFYVLHLCEIEPFEMHIYNRWGQLVFESKDIHNGWDGKYNGNPEPEGVYWLWLSFTLPDKKTFYRTGSVTLVR